MMVSPSCVLAFLAAVGGVLNLPFKSLEFLGEWLDPVFQGVDRPTPSIFDAGLALDGISVLFAVAGIGARVTLYRRGLRTPDGDPLRETPRAAARRVGQRLLLRRGHRGARRRPGAALAGSSTETSTSKVIDGAVNGVGHARA